MHFHIIFLIEDLQAMGQYHSRNNATICWYSACNNLICSFFITISVNSCLEDNIIEYLFWKCMGAICPTLIIPSSSIFRLKIHITEVICWILVVVCLFLDTITRLKRLPPEAFYLASLRQLGISQISNFAYFRMSIVHLYLRIFNESNAVYRSDADACNQSTSAINFFPVYNLSRRFLPFFPLYIGCKFIR